MNPVAFILLLGLAVVTQCEPSPEPFFGDIVPPIVPLAPRHVPIGDIGRLPPWVDGISPSWGRLNGINPGAVHQNPLLLLPQGAHQNQLYHNPLWNQRRIIELPTAGYKENEAHGPHCENELQALIDENIRLNWDLKSLSEKERNPQLKENHWRLSTELAKLLSPDNWRYYQPIIAVQLQRGQIPQHLLVALRQSLANGERHVPPAILNQLLLNQQDQRLPNVRESELQPLVLLNKQKNLDGDYFNAKVPSGNPFGNQPQILPQSNQQNVILSSQQPLISGTSEGIVQAYLPYGVSQQQGNPGANGIAMQYYQPKQDGQQVVGYSIPQQVTQPIQVALASPQQPIATGVLVQQPYNSGTEGNGLLNQVLIPIQPQYGEGNQIIQVPNDQIINGVFVVPANQQPLSTFN